MPLEPGQRRRAGGKQQHVLRNRQASGDLVKPQGIRGMSAGAPLQRDLFARCHYRPFYEVQAGTRCLTRVG